MDVPRDVPRAKSFEGKLYYLYGMLYSRQVMHGELDRVVLQLKRSGSLVRVVRRKTEPMYLVYSTSKY